MQKSNTSVHKKVFDAHDVLAFNTHRQAKAVPVSACTPGGDVRGTRVHRYIAAAEARFRGC